MPKLIGVDVGTTGVRAVAIDEQGRVLTEASAGYGFETPRPGWSEQDPRHWSHATQAVLRELAPKVGGGVAGLGLTGQMHGAVFLDRHGEVIRPAILWNDQRTAAECEEIEAAVGAQRLRAITGNPALTGFQAPKVLWLRKHEPGHYERIARLLLPKDYIRLLLTGETVSDASDAAGTLLFDLKQRRWSSEILTALQLPVAWLPEVMESPAPSGRIRESIAARLGLSPGIPVAAGAGDNAAAAIGTGIIGEGLLSCSVGTSGVLFAHSDRPRVDPSGRLHAFCHAVPGAYHLMAVTLSAGGSLRWWRDLVAPNQSYDDLAAEAAAIEPGAEGLIFTPYLTGERTPHLDPKARGMFTGLTVRHGRPHLTRAVMEGVGFSLRDGLEIIRELGVLVGEIRLTGGGARSPLWRQMLADIFAVPLTFLPAAEGPAFGAALLAGVAAGVFGDVSDACRHLPSSGIVIEPDGGRSARYAQLYQAYRQLYPATQHLMHRLISSYD
jgi:xylulokinase